MVAGKKELIVFRLDASHERGMGHLYRMKTLADEFRKNAFYCFFLLRTNDIAASILNKTSYNYMFCPQDYSEEEIVDKYFLKHPKPNLWIFDILTTESEWVFHVKKNDVPVVCFDDLKGGVLAADLVINAIAGCWNEGLSGSQVLSGPRYAIINSDILGLKKTKELSGGAIKVGVTLGGSDTHGAIIMIAQVLSKMTDIDVTFFLGPHFQHNQELTKLLPQLSFQYSVRKAVKNLHRELSGMHTVICGGGQTLFELCAMGMAVMSLANESYEEKTISYFARHGACVNIGSVHNKIDIGLIQRYFKKLRSEPKEMHLLKTNAQRLVDGGGIYRSFNECSRLIHTSNDRLFSDSCRSIS